VDWLGAWYVFLLVFLLLVPSLASSPSLSPSPFLTPLQPQPPRSGCSFWIHKLISQTVLILKYIIPDYTGYLYYGGANVAMNGGIMISYVPSFSSPLLSIPIYPEHRKGVNLHPMTSTRLSYKCDSNAQGDDPLGFAIWWRRV
jgi:hypothetical protein